MAVIELETRINAELHVCFDLSRSIDLHLRSFTETGEQVIDGKARGLINLNDTVTWRARHFAMIFEMKVSITEFVRPFFFEDAMIRGPFNMMRHTHVFQKSGDVTLMRDYFEYELPFGALGRWIDRVLVSRHLKNLLERRNGIIKEIAETRQHNLYVNI